MSNVSSHPIVVAPVDKPSSKTNVIYIRGLPDDVMEYIDQETELYGISRNLQNSHAMQCFLIMKTDSFAMQCLYAILRNNLAMQHSRNQAFHILGGEDRIRTCVPFRAHDFQT